MVKFLHPTGCELSTINKASTEYPMVDISILNLLAEIYGKLSHQLS